MDIDQALAALRSVVESQPDLAWKGYRAGFRSPSEFETARAEWFSVYHAAEFQRAISFLDLVPVARRKKIKARDSYVLKHSAEVWFRNPQNPDRAENGGHGYVSNGALIAAAIYRDFPVEPIPFSFNAMIGKVRGHAFEWPLVQCALDPKSGPSIYFISDGDGLVKIGFSADVDKRMRALATGSPRPLHLLLAVRGSRSDEAAFHEMFEAEHMRGEWFRLSKRIERFINNGGR